MNGFVDKVCLHTSKSLKWCSLSTTSTCSWKNFIGNVPVQLGNSVNHGKLTSSLQSFQSIYKRVLIQKVLSKHIFTSGLYSLVQGMEYSSVVI